MSITKTCSVEVDEALLAACEPFDYTFTGYSVFTAPIFNAPKRDGSWGIGLIVGPSGSGKTSILRAHYGITPEPEWYSTEAVVSQVSSEKLQAVGLNSIPSWCRPYHVLSNGEAFRARMAKALSSDTSFDEFTSVVDRTVAKSCSHAIQRHIRDKKLTGIVFSSCHYDIVEWLSPDWIFDTQTGTLSLGRLPRRSPTSLDIREANKSDWSIFRTHHYLTSELNKSARCYAAYWGDQLVAFAAALPYPSGTLKNAWRGHRTVVLPDYQGLGIGVRLSDWVARHLVLQGKRYYSKTAHPRMGEYREASPNWKPTSKNRLARRECGKNTYGGMNKTLRVGKLCYSHEYILTPAQDLL